MFFASQGDQKMAKVCGIALFLVLAGLVFTASMLKVKPIKSTASADKGSASGKCSAPAVLEVNIDLPNEVTKVSCGREVMIIEHGTPGQPGYTRKVYRYRQQPQPLP